jgi:hypothetical protein
VCETIVQVAYGEVPPEELVIATRKAATAAARAQQQAFSTLGGHLVAASRRLLVIVDRPFWRRANSFDELAANSIEFLAQIMPPIVCHISEQTIPAEQAHAEAIYIRVPELDDSLAALFDDVFANYNVIATVVVSAVPQSEEQITGYLDARETAPWWLSIADGGADSGLSFRSNNTPWEPAYAMEQTQEDAAVNIIAAAFERRFLWNPR